MRNCELDALERAPRNLGQIQGEEKEGIRVLAGRSEPSREDMVGQR